MVFKYKRLTLSPYTYHEVLRRARGRLPVSFLRQQLLLLGLIFASLTLLLITTIFVPDLEDEPSQISEDTSYGVIVDCGSSGSRAHIFKWNTYGVDKKIELVKAKSDSKGLSLHITPGLSTFRDNPDRASNYLEPLMQIITEVVPPTHHLSTPIFFLATAGMRLVEETVRKKILNAVTRDLRAKFNFPRIKSKTISGAAEGVYSWLSLNINKHDTSDSSNPKSYGMLEMGGASVQVTFELDDETRQEILTNLSGTEAIQVFEKNQVDVSLMNGKSTRLFAITFLGLGVNSARDAYVDVLVKEHLNASGSVNLAEDLKLQKFSGYLTDPCLTVGSSDIVSRPISLLDTNQSIGRVTKPGEKTFSINFNGSGDFLNCHILLKSTIEAMKLQKLNCPLDNTDCPMTLLGTNFIPFSRFQFIGLSEFFYTTSEVLNSDGLFDRQKVLHETMRICSTRYDKLQELYARTGVSRQDRIFYECFKASWLLTVLHTSGFMMPLNYSNFYTADRINGHEVDWTIGAMLMEIAPKRALLNTAIVT